MQNLIQYFLWLVKPNVTTSLQQKKFRQIHKLFIAEGAKVIQEFLLSNFVVRTFVSPNLNRLMLI
jgi:hypothetical protein